MRVLRLWFVIALVGAATAFRRVERSVVPSPAFALTPSLRGSLGAAEVRQKTVERFTALNFGAVELRHTRTQDDPHIEGWHITSHDQVTAGGLPVVGAQLNVVWNAENEIVSVTGATIDPSELPTFNKRDAPAVGIHDAVISAKKALPERECSTERAELVAFAPGIQRGHPEELRVSWLIKCDSADVYVDSQTSAVLAIRKRSTGLIVKITNSSGTVWSSVVNSYPTGNATYDAFIIAVNTADDAYRGFTGYSGYDNGNSTTITGLLADWDTSPSEYGGRITSGLGYISTNTTNTALWHEFAHAITENLDDLWSEAQSGALDEAFSDMFSQTLDVIFNGDINTVRTAHQCAAATGSKRWIVAWDCPHPDVVIANRDNVSMPGVRDMWDPTCILNRPYDVASMDCGVDDTMGVHHNAGIPGHFYAYFVDGFDAIEGVGVQVAFHIVLRSKFLTTSIATFQQFATALRTSCTQIKNQTLRNITGYKNVFIPEDACVKLEAAISMAGLDDEIPCYSAVPTFQFRDSKNNLIFPRKILLYDDIEDTYAFPANGNVSSGSILVYDSSSTTVQCSTPQKESLQMLFGSPDDEPVWTTTVGCPAPNPITNALKANTTYNLTVTISGSGGSSTSSLWQAIWYPLPVISSVTSSDNLQKVSLTGYNWFATLGTYCGANVQCNYCYACLRLVDAPDANSTICKRVSWAKTVSKVYACQSSLTVNVSSGSRMFMYCTNHGVYHYPEPTVIRNPTVNATFCFNLTGVVLNVTEKYSAGAECTTNSEGCCSVTVEKGIPYAIEAIKEGYSKLSDVATAWKNQSSFVFTLSAVQEDSSTSSFSSNTATSETVSESRFVKISSAQSSWQYSSTVPRSEESHDSSKGASHSSLHKSSSSLHVSSGTAFSYSHSGSSVSLALGSETIASSSPRSLNSLTAVIFSVIFLLVLA